MTKTDTNITLPSLARRLGLQHYQVEYLIQTRRIPDGKVREGAKRKTWTVAQVEMIERWHRDYTRLDAGCCGE